MTTTTARLVQEHLARQAIADELLSPTSRVQRQLKHAAEDAFINAEIARQDADMTIPDARPPVVLQANEYVHFPTREVRGTSVPRLADSPRGEWPIPEPRSWDWVVVEEPNADEADTARVPGLCIPDHVKPGGSWAREGSSIGPIIAIVCGTGLVLATGVWAALSYSYREDFASPSRPRLGKPPPAAGARRTRARVTLKPGFANANLRAEPWGDIIGYVLADAEVEIIESRNAADPDGTMARWHRVRALDGATGWMHGNLLPG